MPPFFYLCSAAVLLSLASVAPAQQDGAPTVAPDRAAAAGYTFHVDTDLLQIPVLVLSRSHQLLPPIDPRRFRVAIAGGKKFQPKVHLEDAEPIALSLLLDASSLNPTDLAQSQPVHLAAAFANLSAGLHAADAVSVDRLDHCLLRHVLRSATPATGPLENASSRAMAPLSEAEQRQFRAGCTSSVKLWDGLAITMMALAQDPGRRVLLVLSTSQDTGSRTSVAALRLYAVAHDISIFALTGIEQEGAARAGDPNDAAPQLAQLCQLTGGVALPTSLDRLPQDLATILSFVRNRYIVEFPRPDHFHGAANPLEVTVNGLHGFIRPAGISFPLDQRDTNAPSAATKAQPRPVPGERVVLLP